MRVDRRVLWAAVSAAVGLGSSHARAAEPTQQELLEQIKALQAKVERLETRQDSQAAQTQPAAAQAGENTTQPATVGSVLRDAERRSDPLMFEGGTFTA